MAQGRLSTPALSVVLVAPFGFATMRRLIGHLRAQTIRDRLEIIFVAPSRMALAADESLLTVFWGHTIIEAGSIPKLAPARVLGLHAARAPIVVLTEDHCYPVEDWAEHLIRAHEAPWAVVGPVVELANPQLHRAWANYLLQYGWWVQTNQSGEIDHLPGHNSCYKRDVLLSLGDRLTPLLVAETVLHWELGRLGHRLYLESRARVRHVYMTQFRPYVHENFVIGRQFAASRSRRWPWWRRLAFALGAPLIPLVRVIRIAGLLRKAGWLRKLPFILPWLMIGLVMSALGESLGYAFGMGTAETSTLDLDFRRERFISREERAALLGQAIPGD